MATVAKAAPGTIVRIAGDVFDFGEDGTRQVSQAERDLLEQSHVSIEFVEEKPKTKKGSS